MITAALSPVANHPLAVDGLRRGGGTVDGGVAAEPRFGAVWDLANGVGEVLVPFSLLVSLGGEFGWRTAPAIAQPPLSFLLEEIGRPQVGDLTFGLIARSRSVVLGALGWRLARRISCKWSFAIVAPSEW
jgi:hypothetical protein